MTHLESIKKMRELLKNILDNCTVDVENRKFNFSSCANNIDRFAEEVLKNTKDWLNIYNIDEILSKNVSDILEDRFPIINYINYESNKIDIKKITSNLKELLGEETIEKIIETIIGYLDSIPRSYSIHFPMTFAKTSFGKNNVSLSESISNKEYFDKDEIPTCHQKESLLGISFGSRKLVGESYTYDICIAQSGYVGYSVNSTFTAALSKFKQLIYLGLLCDVFREEKNSFSDFGLFEEQLYLSRISAVIYDNAKPSEVVCKIRLPRNIANYIEKIALNESNEQYPLAAKKIGVGAIIDYFNNILKFPIKLINTPEENNDTLPIKTAIEWAFDSEINENDTVSFLQICLGLEAILGYELDHKEQPLSKTLADRCAYLIGMNIQERKRIKDHFKKLYDLRSKLVHGRAVRLHDNEKVYLNWGKEILNRVILKEMEYLKLDEK